VLQLETTEKLARRRIELLDPADYAAKLRFLNDLEPKMARAALGLWKKQQGLITDEVVRRVNAAAKIPARILDAWEEQAQVFVEKSALPATLLSLETAGRRMARKINSTRKDIFGFDLEARLIQQWATAQAGALIVNLTQAQRAACNALIVKHVYQDPLSPYQLGRLLRCIVGLTERETLAVLHFRERLLGSGLSGDQIANQAERYAARLLKLRGERIGRTELANAYGKGIFESVNQARAEGYIEGQVNKKWDAIDDEKRTCSICLDLDGEEVPYDQAFSNGSDHDPAHIMCRCSVNYIILR